MIPGAKDCDYENGEEPLTREQIQRFAKSYEKYQFIDHEHGLTKEGRKIGQPVNSFLLTHDTTMNTLDGSKTYPSGTWMMTSQLTDEVAIKNAMDGGYTGYSVSVFNRERADKYLEALKHDEDTPMPTACKTINSGGTALIKDITDPVVLSVSLVKSPCLHDSKFCELDGDIMTDEVKSMKSKILDAMGMSEQAEVEALKSEVVSLESKIDEMQKDFKEALKSMQDAFEAKLTEALTPVTEEPVAEKAEEEVEEEPVEEPTEVEETTEEEVEEEPEETEPVAEKGHSKAEPVHDNVQAEKSQPFNVYTAMGRNLDGTAKRH
jgi:predicted transcriptional regulator